MNTVVLDNTVSWLSNQIMRPSLDANCNVTIIQFPFDMCVSWRPGTRHGPYQIMQELGRQSAYCADRRIDISSLTICDAGSVPSTNQIQKYYEQVTQTVGTLPKNTILLGIGGDHSVSDPIVRGQLKRGYDPVGVIVIDAHFDSRPPTVGTEHSGHWMFTLRDLVDYRNVAQLGISANIYGPQHMAQAESAGAYVRTVSELRQHGIGASIKDAINHVCSSASGFHLSIDIDAIDQAFCPGTSVPNPCGLFPYEVSEMIYAASQHTCFIGMDIMEVSPPLDDNNRTSQVSAQLIIAMLAGLSTRFPRQFSTEDNGK